MSVRRGIGLTAVAVAGALITLLTDGTLLGYAWWAVAPGLAVLAVALGIRRHRPERPRPWYALLGAIAFLWAGWIMSAAVGAEIASPRILDSVGLVRNLIYVFAYPSLGAAALYMAKSRTDDRDRDNVIDALIVMVALATVLGAWLFGGHDIAEDVSGTDRLWVTIAPLVLAAVVTATMRVLFAAGQHIPAVWLLLAGSVLTLVGNLWTAQLLRDGLPTQIAEIDVLWILGFTAVAAAATHPSMREVTQPAARGDLIDGMPVDRLVLLGASLLAAPLAHLRVASGTAESHSIVTGGVVIGLLVMWRVARLIRERDVARQALSAAAERDAAIAQISRWALDDRSAQQLLDDSAALLSMTLDGTPGAIVPPGREPEGWSVPASLRFPLDDGIAPIADIVVASELSCRRTLGQREFLETAAALLSSAVRRRAAEERLRHDALHDSLTGLPNRGLALNRLNHMLGRRDIASVSVLFLDLDGFKLVNDTFGHAAGDQLLIELADRLAGSVRLDDTVSRFAGDEYVILVPGCDQSALEQLVARVQAATTMHVGEGPQTITVTASIGVATGQGDVSDGEALLHQADAAMYRAKQRGGAQAAWADHASSELLMHDAQSLVR